MVHEISFNYCDAAYGFLCHYGDKGFQGRQMSYKTMNNQPLSTRQKIGLALVLLLVPIALLYLSAFMYEHVCIPKGAACNDSYQQPVPWEQDGTWGKIWKKIF